MEATSLEFELVPVDEFDALFVHPREAEAYKEIEIPSQYPAKLHAKKVVRELGARNGIIYLAGGDEATYEYSDMGPVFRQRRYFFYLSGAKFAGCVITHHIGHDELILWVPTVDPKKILWYGRIPTFAEYAAASDVDHVRDAADLPRYIARTVNQYTPLYVLDDRPDSLPRLPRDSRRAAAGWMHHDTFPSTMWRYMAGIPNPAAPSLIPGQISRTAAIPYNATRLRPAVDQARVIKTAYEIATIRKANAVSSAAHAAVLDALTSMKSERDVEAMFLRECVRRGAKYQAYPVIAGSGANAASLHYEANNDALEGKELIVLDAGCEWNCYASDITRTLPIGGRRLSHEAKEIYALVDRMQTTCIENVRPGTVYYGLHVLAHRIAAEGLLKLCILKWTGDEEASEHVRVNHILSTGVTAAFFPHGLGHHVGLETHDLPGRQRLLLSSSRQDMDWKKRMQWGRRALVDPEELVDMIATTMDPVPKNNTEAPPPPYSGQQKLEPGMVVTIEPGIYFCREYIEGYFLSDSGKAKYINQEVLEKYYPVGGVRIEDDILVTSDGWENLTTAPKPTMDGE